MTESLQRWKSQSLGAIFLTWLRPLWSTPPGPNPWPQDIEDALQAPDALEVCHHCFTPQDELRWFCPQCGAAVGPHNNWMHYVYIFSIGEVFRSGVGPEARFTKLTVPGYIAIGFLQLGVLSPLYFIRLFLNWRSLSRRGSHPPAAPASEPVDAPAVPDEER